MYVHITKYMSSTGIIMHFGRPRYQSLKCVLGLVASLHTRKFLQMYLALLGSRSRTPSKTLIFSHLITANRIKPRSEIYNGIVI